MRRLLGKSLEGREIEAFLHPGTSGPGGATLLIGGTHGDERATVVLLQEFIRTHLESGAIREPVAVIPLLNPDGYARDTRYNARGADINRNFPRNWSPRSEEPSGAAPLSEPEARLLHDFILELEPAKIVSLHWALAEIDADGPQSADLARHLWDSLPPDERAPYRLRLDGGAGPGTPGSLGQWCGFGLPHLAGGRGPAMITLELPWHPRPDPRPDPLPDDHFAEVRALWAVRPEEYLAGVRGPVHRMLSAACRFPGPGAGPG